MSDGKIRYPGPDPAEDLQAQCKTCEAIFPAGSSHDCPARVIRPGEVVVRKADLDFLFKVISIEGWAVHGPAVTRLREASQMDESD